ncbi:transcriptional repressor LexA [Patescibacteria group bacterium]|nr:transcriptional repressor LexA [Patescibacteria group bacterium]
MRDTHYSRKIHEFYRAHWRMPSYAEIMDITGLQSKDSVFKLVTRLERAGILRKDRRGRLLPRSIMGEIKLLGLVEAGFPSPAEEELVDTITLDEYLIQNRDATYLLKVKGDSMKDAGIVEGDMVIAERTASPKVGQIVVAEIDGEWTMKYLRKKGTAYYLEAANDRYPDIHPEGELKIAAVVRGVVRKY